MDIDINKIGQALYGDNWRAPLAKALDVNERTMRRWEKGEFSVNPEIKPELVKLIDQNIQSLTECKIMLTTPSTQLEPIKALVFVSAWAETADKIIKVGDDVALPEVSSIDDSYGASANGSYQIVMIEPTQALKKLAGHSVFYVANSTDYFAKNSKKITAATSLYINDLIEKSNEHLQYADDFKASKNIEREIESLNKCYRFSKDDVHYLNAYFFNA